MILQILKILHIFQTQVNILWFIIYGCFFIINFLLLKTLKLLSKH